jgi:hypothetical protein
MGCEIHNTQNPLPLQKLYLALLSMSGAGARGGPAPAEVTDCGPCWRIWKWSRHVGRQPRATFRCLVHSEIALPQKEELLAEHERLIRVHATHRSLEIKEDPAKLFPCVKCREIFDAVLETRMKLEAVKEAEVEVKAPAAPSKPDGFAEPPIGS